MTKTGPSFYFPKSLNVIILQTWSFPVKTFSPRSQRKTPTLCLQMQNEALMVYTQCFGLTETLCIPIKAFFLFFFIFCIWRQYARVFLFQCAEPSFGLLLDASVVFAGCKRLAFLSPHCQQIKHSAIVYVGHTSQSDPFLFLIYRSSDHYITLS